MQQSVSVSTRYSLPLCFLVTANTSPNFVEDSHAPGEDVEILVGKTGATIRVPGVKLRWLNRFCSFGSSKQLSTPGDARLSQ